MLLLIAQPLIDKRPGKGKNREAAQGRIQRESLVEEITRRVTGSSLWAPNSSPEHQEITGVLSCKQCPNVFFWAM